MPDTKVFISHAHDDKEIALAWKELIRHASAGAIEAWLSSDPDPDGGMTIGERWNDVIYRRLEAATHVLAIVTPRSLLRPWIWWECGVATGVDRERKLIPIVHGMPLDSLPEPMSAYQAYSGDDREFITQVCMRLARGAGLESAALSAESFARFEQRVASSGAMFGAPAAGFRGVLVDHSHGQNKWNYDRATAPALLEPDHLRARLDAAGIGQIEVKAVDPGARIINEALTPWAGLVLAMPLHSRLAPDEREAVAAWVDRGGRLLLLGYEYGDYHHGGNLNALAHDFGLSFQSDIVAPPAWPRAGKRPYGAPVTYPVVAGAHPVSSDLAEVTLVNAQTIRGEPGTISVIGLGPHLIGRPSNPAHLVRYRNREWQLFPELETAFAPSDGSQAVLVQAPGGLTGEGAVLALGTWNARSDRLLVNLIRWLAGQI